MKDNFKRVTRADVAKHAGVSATVVSYVVNNNRYVDKAKRARVEKAIRELNYRPNPIARVLKGKNSNNVAFIADQITNEHFSLLVSEMEQHAYELGYIISLCANRNTEEFVSEIIGRMYDGIVISSISITEEYVRRFQQAGIPVVLLVNRDYTSIENAGRINTGLYQGERDSLRHLIDRGRERILYLDRFSVRGNFSSMSDLRYRGFVEQMQQAGLPFSDENIITGCATEEEVLQKVQQRIQNGFAADGICGRNDRLACIGMKAVQQLGLSVPKDVSIMGFDNSNLSKYTTPTLSTVEMQRNEIGRVAIDMIHEMIETGKAPEPMEFSTRLVLREST